MPDNYDVADQVAIDDDTIPLPRDDTTPPVIKINLVIYKEV